MEQDKYILTASDITKSFGKLQVLKGVDLEVKTSEIVTIMGKSGSGKSTLLHILGSLDNPDNGRLFIKGNDLISMKSKDLATFRNNEIGFIFQFHHLLNEFTAIENIIMPALIKGIDPNKAKDKALELLDYLNLVDRKEHKPSQMSGGEQQRVAVARALINSPAIVFADEPSGNLDYESSTELHDLFLQLRKDFNQTFVIVTHNSDLAKLSDRTLTMEDGKIK